MVVAECGFGYRVALDPWGQVVGLKMSVASLVIYCIYEGQRIIINNYLLVTFGWSVLLLPSNQILACHSPDNETDGKQSLF